jgi:hypothetical protein
MEDDFMKRAQSQGVTMYNIPKTLFTPISLGLISCLNLKAFHPQLYYVTEQ